MTVGSAAWQTPGATLGGVSSERDMCKKAWAGCAVLLLVAGCVHPHSVQESRGATTPGVQPSPAPPNAAPPVNSGTGRLVPAPPTQTVQPGETAEPAEKPARVPSPSPGGRAAPTAGTSAGGATPAKSAAKPPSPAVPAPAALDLTSLEQRLRDTRAIGVFTKLSLKNQVDDLLAQFRAFHRGQSTITLAALRQRFELLLLKVVSLLQDDDAQLAAAVSSSREAIWAVLVDPVKFARL